MTRNPFRVVALLECSKKECSELNEQRQSFATELYQLQQSFMQNEHRRRQSKNPWKVDSTRSSNESSTRKKRFHYKPTKDRPFTPRDTAVRSKDNEQRAPNSELESFDFQVCFR